MQAIITRYHGPTENRGARISASTYKHRTYISYPHELNQEKAHMEAARAHMLKMGWSGTMQSGGLPNGDMVHCFIDIFAQFEVSNADVCCTFA